MTEELPEYNQPGTKVLAIDAGYAITGLAVMQDTRDGWAPILLHAVFTEAPKGRRDLYVAHVDAERMSQAASQIAAVIAKHGIRRVVAEIPDAGCNDFKAGRCMALATGMLAAVVGMTDVAVEWYSPNATRDAGLPGWRTLKGPDGKRLKGPKMKRKLVEAVTARYPQIADLPNYDWREACADAIATFEAARRGNLVKL